MGAVTVFVIMAVAWLQKCDNRKDKALYNFAHGKLITTSTAQQWIPCSERLPERDEIVLVSYKTTDNVHMCKYLDDGSENTWWSYNDDCLEWNNVILAWMPLPEPYKGGDTNDVS